MQQTVETGIQAWCPSGERPLPERIAEAVRNRATPISQLLRLMAALDAQDHVDHALRGQLRARIGAPLGG